MFRTKMFNLSTNAINILSNNVSSSSLCKRLQGKVAIITASTDG